MIATRPDWCISRQRVWGVPIIVFYCEDCSEPFTDARFSRSHRRALPRAHRRRLVLSAPPPNCWGPACTCAKCGGAEFRKETDILDVWFDSGSSHLAVLTPANDLPWPADMYLEGGDQYRGWFHSSLLIGVGLEERIAVSRLRHPRLDARRRGPGHAQIARQRHRAGGVIQRNGADLLRLWVASVDFSEDVRMSGEFLTGFLRPIASCATLSATCSATCPISIRHSIRCLAHNCRDRSLDSGARRRSGAPLPCLVRRI